MRIPGASSHLISESSVVIVLWVLVFAVLARMGDVDSVSHAVEFVLFVTAFPTSVSLLLAIAAATGVVVAVGHQLFNSRLKCSLCVLVLHRLVSKHCFESRRAGESRISGCCCCCIILW